MSKQQKNSSNKNSGRVSVLNSSKGLSFSSQLLLLGALLLFTFLVYKNSLHGALLNFDDLEYFNNYPEVLTLSWKSIGTYFSKYYVIMYQPLPVLSFALNYHFSGLNTFPMHLVNLFFHLCNIVLVFSLIKKVSKRFDVAFIVAVLFALHPMNVEAVSWVSARSSGMYAFFYLLSLICYVDYLDKGLKLKKLVPVLLFFILSLFSKAQAVTLPVVLLLFDYYYKRKLLSRQVLLEKLPFFVLSVIFGIVAMSDSSTMANITKGMMVNYSLIDEFFLVCYSFVFYIYKLLFPFTLAAVYVYPPKIDGHLPFVYYFAPFVLVLLAFLVFRARRNRYVLFGTALFLATVSLNVQVIPSRLFIVTERYGYFPFIGLFFILAMFYADLADKKLQSIKQFKSVFLAGLSVYAVLFAFTVYGRNEVWTSDIPFMTDILEKNPEVPYLYRAHGNRGCAYMDANNYRDAISDFTEAIRLKPDDGQSYFNRGLCYAKLLQYKEAIANYDTAIEKGGGKFLVYSNRAMAKINDKDFRGGLEDCNRAIALDSTQSDIYNTRSVAEYVFKDLAAVERDLSKVIALNPNNDFAYKNRGSLYFELHRLPEACMEWKKAADLGNQEARNALDSNCK